MRISYQILAALVLGSLLGIVFPDHTAVLGEFGKVVIQLIKMAAVPLMFVIILNAIVNSSVGLKQSATLLGVCTINTGLALLIGLGLSTIFKPGAYFSLTASGTSETAASSQTTPRIDFMASLQSYIPQSFVEPFASNTIIGVVIIALLLGFALRQTKRELANRGEYELIFEQLEQGFGLAQRVFEVILLWCVKLVPLAVFVVIAKTVGQYGFAPLAPLLRYTALCLFGFFLQIALVYHGWLLFYVHYGIRDFWKIVWHPFVYAFGVNSSLATLPLTLASLKKLGVSNSAAALGACVGTNLNNDGIVLYEGIAVIFIAQLYGIDLSFSQQLLVMASCLIAAIGVAGVPEAGFVSLSLVVATVGLPTEVLPMLLTVDWLLARCRSSMNVLSDHMVSLIINRRDLANTEGKELSPEVALNA